MIQNFADIVVGMLIGLLGMGSSLLVRHIGNLLIPWYYLRKSFSERTARLPGDIAIDHLSIHLGRNDDRFEAVRDLNIHVSPGEFICILGPSGCGKSTLLGALAGHLAPSAGQMRVDDAPVAGPSPERGMVFQHHTLFPWARVIDNVAFGLKMRGLNKNERHRRAREILKLVGLDGFEQRWPSQLSGGMQQRVEIARVLVNHPRLLLMDEPFGALDAQTRMDMQQLLLDIWTRIRTTVVFVTHDIDGHCSSPTRAGDEPAPGGIIDDIAVTFRGRGRRKIVTTPEFSRLKRYCLELLRHEQAQALPRLSPLGLGAE